MDEPVETDAQLRQHCVHVLPVHGLPHVLHLPTDVGTDLGAGLRRRRGRRGGGQKRVALKQAGNSRSSAFFCFAKKLCSSVRDLKVASADLFSFARGHGAGSLLTVVYWIMTLFSSSGLKSVFFCSVAKICFICPTMQFSVLRGAGKIGGENHLGCNCVSAVPFPKGERKTTLTCRFLCPASLPSAQSPLSSCAGTRPTSEMSWGQIFQRWNETRPRVFRVLACKPRTYLIRGMSWSLNCLSNRWKIELAC